MNRNEYILKLEGAYIDNKVVAQVESAYHCTLPTELKKIVSFSMESIFFDDDFRTLSYSEILDAQSDLHIDFQSLGLIPIIDCGENNFIVFHINDGSWSKFNIVDETVFKKRSLLKELLT